MDSYAMLDKVIELLRSRGRVTYGALKLQFGLDNEQLEVLKDEIISAQRLAMDEDGRILVWTRDGEGTPDAASPPAPPTQQASLQQDQPSQKSDPSPTPRIPEAERRQLTVMFCDLVDSTKLSSQLDPEEYREVVRAYQKVCSEVITRFDGHIAQLLGDGLLVYFGYPQAHEDDAHRAVRTGLGILAVMGELNSRLQQDKGIQLAIHIGIHTGLVVVGEMGGAGRQEQLALGEVPNVASRIEGLTAPNTMAISEATYRLLQGYFECQAFGAQALRGVAEPIHVYRVLQDSGARGRLDVAVTRGLTPLVGRESEVTLLMERWAQVKDGQGHVVLLTGDAGIGKSRLVQRLKEHVANESHIRWECRSSEYYQNTALFPLVELFQRILQFEAHETPDEKLGKLEHALSQYRLPLEESVPLFAPLLLLPIPEDRYPLLNLSPQRQRQKTLETIIALLLELAEHQPVLFIVEDLHWTDPTTLELLNLLIEQIPTTSILALLTCRPHFQPAWHHRSYLTEMTVHRLSLLQVGQIVTGMANGKTFPAEVLQQIIAKTDGVPLFVEEMTKAILESGHLKAEDGHYALTGSLSTFAIPATLQDSLMARLDRLVTAKAVAQYAAVIGRQFAYDLLQAVSQVDEVMLQHELGRLVEAEIVYQRGVPPQSTYVFKHALIQDAAYESLLKSTRQQYHQRIAQVLESQFPEMAEAQPEFVAHHFTEAGLLEQAVAYWYKAGQKASERSAHVEAMYHLTKSLALLQTLPEIPQRLHQELAMHIALGKELIGMKGYAAPEVQQVYAHALTLCQTVEKPLQTYQVLRGLASYYLIRGELQTTLALRQQLLQMAQQQQDPAMLLDAHEGLGFAHHYLGKFLLARVHYDQSMTLCDPQDVWFRHSLSAQNHVVTCQSHAAQNLWYLGYPDQALHTQRAALVLAQEIVHPLTLAHTLGYAAFRHQRRREVVQVREYAEAVMSLASEHGMALWEDYGIFLRGWALAMQGHEEDGLAQMRQGITTHRATGAELLVPGLLTILGEVYGQRGQPAEGLTTIAEALVLMHRSGECRDEAELYRVKGALLLQQPSDNSTEAESCFHHAINIAQNQQAKSWELRAATSSRASRIDMPRLPVMLGNT